MLDLPTGACVAIIGAGGKTTTMLALAACADEVGSSVVLTTTTKIWPPAGLLALYGSHPTSLVASVRSALKVAPVVVGRALGADGKVHGFEPEVVCELRSARARDLMLCEADGAAGRSIKVHGEHEPLVPPCADLVLILAGLDAIGRHISAGVVHRLEPFLRLTGTQQGDSIAPRHLADALLRAAELIPSRMPVIFVLNKADDCLRIEHAFLVRQEVQKLRPAARVVFTSHGSLIPLRRDTPADQVVAIREP
jgi:probable selenium-dependent hydroxylase accessory protein YqeC